MLGPLKHVFSTHLQNTETREKQNGWTEWDFLWQAMGGGAWRGVDSFEAYSSWSFHAEGAKKSRTHMSVSMAGEEQRQRELGEP